MWCLGLALALTPVAAFADAASADHTQAELLNAQAQLQLAQQQAMAIQDQANLSAMNEREIALLKSEALRQRELDNANNATALEQIASSLASAIRAQGQANAQNELAIAQLKAAALTAKADATLANALAQNRPDEIANAQAQSVFLHQLADFLTGVQAQQNMANAVAIADQDPTALETAMAAEAQNDQAMGDDDLLAADTLLNEADLSAESSIVSGSVRAQDVLGHAEAELANAEAMAAEAP